MLLPAVVSESGPFRGKAYAWLSVEPAIGTGERSASLSFYLALVTAHSLGLIGAKGDTVVEGVFSQELAISGYASHRHRPACRRLDIRHRNQHRSRAALRQWRPCAEDCGIGAYWADRRLLRLCRNMATRGREFAGRRLSPQTVTASHGGRSKRCCPSNTYYLLLPKMPKPAWKKSAAIQYV